jgi:hypothetical protein
MSKFNWAGLGVSLLAGALTAGGPALLAGNSGVAGAGSLLGAILGGLTFAQNPQTAPNAQTLTAVAQGLANQEIANVVGRNSQAMGLLAPLVQGAATDVVDSALTLPGTNATPPVQTPDVATRSVVMGPQSGSVRMGTVGSAVPINPPKAALPTLKPVSPAGIPPNGLTAAEWDLIQRRRQQLQQPQTPQTTQPQPLQSALPAQSQQAAPPPQSDAGDTPPSDAPPPFQGV